jgi:hypothetical protein
VTRQARPRSRQEHEATAARILARHAQLTGWTPALPIPIDSMIEDGYGLAILWQPLDDVGDAVVLGALDATSRTIILNERRLDIFERVIGPERFTLAHELSHWVYDAENPDQMTLLEDSSERALCRAPSARLNDSAAIREINANKLAACMLLPSGLVRDRLTTPPFPTNAGLAEAAHGWGVSTSTLRFRLTELGLASLLPT